MTGREKKMVSMAGIALVIFVLVQFVVSPMIEQRSRLQKRLTSKEKALAEMHVLKQQYLQINRQSGSMADTLGKREEGFSLFAFLEQNADESALKEHIAYMKPTESEDGGKLAQSRVEMKLQAVSLQQLLRFVEKSESPAHLVGVAKMTVQENTKDKGSLDATLVMVSVERSGNADEH
nr:type II secretion system protein GspM [uncultured Desulfobulbus sp.]